MAKNTITLALNGEPTIHQFATAVSNLETLVQRLSKELNAEGIQWIIHDLQISSAIATIRGESDVLQQVERIVNAYGDVGKALEAGRTPEFSEPVVKAARAITGILDKQVPSIRFETADVDTVVYGSNVAAISQKGIIKTFGAIEGRVQTLTNRKGLRFTLFDVLQDRAVSCYLAEGQEEMIREVWGKRAIIEGEISRDRLSSRPITIRKITSVRLLPEVLQGNYLRARGIAPIREGGAMPEIIIRQLRDAV